MATEEKEHVQIRRQYPLLSLFEFLEKKKKKKGEYVL